ncbi:gamma-glutamyl cyclotransferase, AIG2-like domain-containing protein [Hirsutella rhossiliensis]|uniref:Putative gamma-glutamylcyclotransferase n=1 Tax=Hirsutella rhossiliensis TaxID=111463 RepID=A0A9P8SJR6_9HYPO|nr:gamma-glutamyl cyclotransferase, AIG2-like domain-containing protein [Hirsutella rhossiliensis]KAH0965191.1 gamma-glutamyl cyclotransferase, AIG2-like domain-containing protein [Hirsutella rhossiliensis]
MVRTKPNKTTTGHVLTMAGTLMAPEVFFSVCYGDDWPPKAIRDLHTFTPAILNGYCRHRVQLADYPAVVPQEGHSVRGVYATGLTDANMQKLDYFEGDEYERVKATVQLLEKKGDDQAVSETKETFVYAFLFPECLERREWDFEEFRRDKMKMWTRNRLGYDDALDDREGANGVL